MIKKAILISVLTIVVGVSGCTVHYSSGRNFNHYAKKQTNISSSIQPGGKLYTNLKHMDITVIGQETNECSILADLSVTATSQEIADTVIEQIEIGAVHQTEPQKPDQLVLIVNEPKEHKDDYCVSGNIIITVPSETNLEITTTHGDCRFENIYSTVNIRSTHGDFVFDQIRGDMTAVSTHGNIDVSRSESTSANIKTTHGRIELNDCNIQQIRCSTSHDPIRLRAVQADVFDLHTSHDPIELTACIAKEADLNTRHGSIRGDIAGINRIVARTTHAPIHLRCMNESSPSFSATLNTTHNNIKFFPPGGFAGHVSASTSHGHIHSELPIVVQGVIGDDNVAGTIGQGSGSIILNSTHGNITLKNPQ